MTSISLPYSAYPYGYAPSLLFDPLTGNIYAMNWNAGNISVVNGTTNRVTASLGTGLSPISGVLDTSNGNIYVSDGTDNNVSVWNGANDHFVASVPVGSQPDSLLFDAASNEVFVENLNSGNVSVIDTLTNQVVKNVPTGAAGSSPQVLALDTHDNEVDVGSAITYNLSVISAASLTVVAHPYVSYDSDGLAYAPTQNELFVENGAAGNVTVFNQSENERVVANITTGSAPQGIAFDPVDGDVYVLNSQSPNITVIDPATNRIIASISTDDGLLYQVAVDSSSGNIFAASAGTYVGPPTVRGFQGNITVLADGTNRPIASVPLNVYPVGLTYDPGNGDLIAADVGGQDVYAVDPSTGLATGTAPTGFAWASAYDSLTQDLWVLNWGSDNLTVLNPALHSIANLTLGSSPSAIAFDSANGDIYVTDEGFGDVWVFHGATNSYDMTIPVTPGASLNAILYDPHNQEVYVSDTTGENLTIINGTSQRTVGSIPTGLDTLSLAFDSTNHTIWAANSGNFTVISDATNKSVASALDTYAYGRVAFDVADNVMYDAGEYESIVSAVGASNYTFLGTLYLGELSYTTEIAYVPTVQDVYVSTADYGMISVIGRAPTLYPVEFIESGLPSGTPWSVTLGASGNSSMTNVIGFEVANSTSSFTIGSVTGYTANVTTQSVVVNGAGHIFYIGFSPVGTPTYAVTFQESGLPASTMWSVSLQGNPMSSTTPTIVFTEVDGSFSFTVAPIAGFGATPSSGLEVVSGSPLTQNIAFAPGTGALTAALSAAPATIALGATTNLTTVTGGGSPPFHFTYSRLPGGCTTKDSTVLACTPTGAGSFRVSVTVTDALLHTAQANATVTVQGSSSAGPSSGLQSWEWILIVVVVAAAVLLLVAVSRRRRTRPPPPAVSPPPPPTPPPPPA